MSGDTVCAFRHTVTGSPVRQSAVSSNKIFEDLLRHFVTDCTEQSLLATDDRRWTLHQELGKVLWSWRNVNAEGLVNVSRFRNLQSCELN